MRKTDNLVAGPIWVTYTHMRKKESIKRVWSEIQPAEIYFQAKFSSAAESSWVIQIWNVQEGKFWSKIKGDTSVWDWLKIMHRTVFSLFNIVYFIEELKEEYLEETLHCISK